MSLSITNTSILHSDQNNQLVFYYTTQQELDVFVKELILRHNNKGISVDIQDDQKRTPFFCAASWGNVKTAVDLLNAGAAVHQIDADGVSCLHFAADAGNTDFIEILAKRYVAQNISLDISDNDGTTPLINAIRCRELGACKKLLEYGAEANQLDSKGLSTFYYAIYHENLDIFELLVTDFCEKGGDIDFRDANGMTLLMIASKLNNVRAVNILLKAKASINLIDLLGNSAIIYAVAFGNKELVTTLQENGADFACVGQYGNTPLLVARKYGKKELYPVIKQCDQRSAAYSKELIKRKRLAHILKIPGTTTLLHPSLSRIEQVTVELAGWIPKDFFNIIRKRLKSFFEKTNNIPPGIQLGPILEICEKAAQITTGIDFDTFRRYKIEKKPVCINTGYKGDPGNADHHSTVLIWGNFFIVCDRGGLAKNSFSVCQIDQKKISEEFIKDLCKLKNKSILEYTKFFNETLLSYLAPNQDSICTELNSKMFLPLQEMGNCTWANSEAVIYALFIFQSISYYAALPIEQQISITDICRNCHVFFEQWQTFVIRYEVQKYVAHHSEKAHENFSYPPDWQFLGKIRQKVPSDTVAKIDAFITKR